MPPKNSQTVSLSIETLSTESAGYYVCSAENEFGKSELGVVVIGARQTLPAPDFQNETVITARAGDSVELGCDVIVDLVRGVHGDVECCHYAMVKVCVNVT